MLVGRLGEEKSMKRRKERHWGMWEGKIRRRGRKGNVDKGAIEDDQSTTLPRGNFVPTIHFLCLGRKPCFLFISEWLEGSQY